MMYGWLPILLLLWMMYPHWWSYLWMIYGGVRSITHQWSPRHDGNSSISYNLVYVISIWGLIYHDMHRWFTGFEHGHHGHRDSWLAHQTCCFPCSFLCVQEGMNRWDSFKINIWMVNIRRCSRDDTGSKLVVIRS